MRERGRRRLAYIYKPRMAMTMLIMPSTRAPCLCRSFARRALIERAPRVTIFRSRVERVESAAAARRPAAAGKRQAPRGETAADGCLRRIRVLSQHVSSRLLSSQVVADVRGVI